MFSVQLRCFWSNYVVFGPTFFPFQQRCPKSHYVVPIMQQPASSSETVQAPRRPAVSTSLGFPDADRWCLARGENGIYSMRHPRSYLAMVNYPATVRVSDAGIAAIDDWWNKRSSYSSIGVYAQNSVGQRYGMFTLNINFMGHLQGLKQTPGVWRMGQGGKQWASVERQYFTQEGGGSFCNECTQCSFNADYTRGDFDQGLPLTSFGAELLVGRSVSCDKVFQFEQVFDPTIEGERIVLVIDADLAALEFRLQIRQVVPGTHQEGTHQEGTAQEGTDQGTDQGTDCGKGQDATHVSSTAAGADCAGTGGAGADCAGADGAGTGGAGADGAGTGGAGADGAGTDVSTAGR